MSTHKSSHSVQLRELAWKDKATPYHFNPSFKRFDNDDDDGYGDEGA